MLRFFITLSIGMLFVLLSGCTKNPTLNYSSNVYGFSFIEGKVVGQAGDKVVVEIANKEIVEGNSYIDKLANSIMKNSLFVVGMQTSVDNEQGSITDIRGNQITFMLHETKLQNNQIVKIYIPKKTIAVMDFSLIGIDNNTMDKFVIEDMTTKLVQSGQYLVVERTKLNAILEEHKLADSGLLDEKASSQLGKLVSADIILTGTFSKRGSNWIVNLRLVDVKTGIILTAINENISSKDFHWEPQKDTSNMNEDFEDQQLSPGWNINAVNEKGSMSKSFIDTTIGANGTFGALRIDYKFNHNDGAFEFQNKRLRDVSRYHGIRFYAKADRATTVRICVKDKNFNDSHENKWLLPVNVGLDWKKYEIPFDGLSIGTQYALKFQGGDGTLDLDNIVKVMIEVRAKENGMKSEDSTVWIDEISLY